MTKTKLVPMNQICLLNDCKKLAKFEREGMYYCAKCLDKSAVAIVDHSFEVMVLKDTIVQIDYLSRRLSAKEFSFTRPTTNKTVNNIKELIKLIKEKK